MRHLHLHHRLPLQMGHLTRQLIALALGVGAVGPPGGVGQSDGWGVDGRALWQREAQADDRERSHRVAPHARAGLANRREAALAKLERLAADGGGELARLGVLANHMRAYDRGGDRGLCVLKGYCSRQ